MAGQVGRDLRQVHNKRTEDPTLARQDDWHIETDVSRDDPCLLETIKAFGLAKSEGNCASY